MASRATTCRATSVLLATLALAVGFGFGPAEFILSAGYDGSGVLIGAARLAYQVVGLIEFALGGAVVALWIEARRCGSANRCHSPASPLQ